MLVLEGEWDFNGNDEFTERVAEAVAAGRPHLVIDLGRVEYLDSSMLGSLLSVQKMAEANDWPLGFVQPQEARVWRIFELTALALRFQFFEDRAAAVAGAAVTNGTA